ncbi:hypothetical protein ACQ7DA_04090 [Zafaria sp. J156]|uniref:hypothetical protein n=1 Tax=Zafaria sp. J156 TaxID=3116490 RepID=UPI002E7A8BDB|nr:hypothetical protein [Zafaria sp. J156]MEE1620403.1 hypothetical protein [Zafaria sp. J156]
MYERSGNGWRVSAGTHGQMLVALYLRDLAGIDHPGLPVLSRLAPVVKPSAAAELAPHAAGELKQEWQGWWLRILQDDAGAEQLVAPPHFPAFADSPTLQRLLRAHYGTALTWARARMDEYRGLSREHTVSGRRRVLEQLVEERSLELDGAEQVVELRLVELPLAERRAWFVEPGTVLMSQELPLDETLFRSYLEPIVEFLP